MYLNDMLGYRIGDVHYTEYVMAHNSNCFVVIRLWFVITSSLPIKYVYMVL
jgi:hypothetical protein